MLGSSQVHSDLYPVLSFQVIFVIGGPICVSIRLQLSPVSDLGLAWHTMGLPQPNGPCLKSNEN